MLSAVNRSRPTRWPGAASVRMIVLVLGAMLVSCSPYPVYNASSSGALPSGNAEDEPAVGPDTPVDDSAAEGATFRGEARRSDFDRRMFMRIVDGYLGVPYKKGGTGFDGIDCSHLVSAVYRDYASMRLPDDTRGLYRLTFAVGRNELMAGDLVFFAFGTRSPSHVGIYTGDQRFVHASEKEGVVISSLDDPEYRDAFKGARRVVVETRAEGQ